MAIFRDGVKVGKFDIRTGLSKARAQGILREIGVLEKKDTAIKSTGGEINSIRTIVGRAEGFQMPANFKVSFKCPAGIDQTTALGKSKTKVTEFGLDYKTHIMNRSDSSGKSSEPSGIKAMFDEARTTVQNTYRPFGVESGTNTESKLDLFCSKVMIPEKQITTNLYKHASSPAFPFPLVCSMVQ